MSLRNDGKEAGYETDFIDDFSRTSEIAQSWELSFCH